jgi:hypothetical protein
LVLYLEILEGTGSLRYTSSQEIGLPFSIVRSDLFSLEASVGRLPDTGAPVSQETRLGKKKFRRNIHYHQQKQKYMAEDKRLRCNSLFPLKHLS